MGSSAGEKALPRRQGLILSSQRPVLSWFELGATVEPLGDVFMLLFPDGFIELVAPD
jgi:hypothetical protein